MNKLFSWALGGREQTPPRRAQKRINLALQGGGAHGAFTWGVLDHLLEDGRLAIDGISGASAGAVNAVMLTDGLIRGGPEAARKRLADFWRAASIGGSLPDLQRQVVERLFLANSPAGAPMRTWLHAMERVLSRTNINPLNINPLKQLIERFVDFAAIRADRSRDIFISATNVHTGELRIFHREELTAEAVMASACLPLLFGAVQIEGTPYWDGGYVSNPPLLPFLQTTKSADVLIVQIYPLRRRALPASQREIMGRTGEITFNAPLLTELRALALIDRLVKGCPGGGRRLHLHRIALHEIEDSPDAASRLNNDYEFFQMLRQFGQRAARRFLDTHFDAIGMRGTIELEVEAAHVGR